MLTPLLVSLAANAWLGYTLYKRPHKHVKVSEKVPGVYCHKFKTRKL